MMSHEIAGADMHSAVQEAKVDVLQAPPPPPPPPALEPVSPTTTTSSAGTTKSASGKLLVSDTCLVLSFTGRDI